jgi:hypothetical protein
VIKGGDKLINTPQRAWGEWEFRQSPADGRTLELVWRGHYAIDLESINSTAQMLDWIFHAWHRDGAHLVEAFEAVFSPRANCCSNGVEKHFSGKRLAQAYARKIEKKKSKLPARLRFEVLSACRFRCQACGASASSGAELHIDHILPRSKGGTDDRWNLQVLCRDCNLGKGDRFL